MQVERLPDMEYGPPMKTRVALVIFLLALGVNPRAFANDNKTWADISDVSVVLLMGSALATPTIKGDWEGLRQSAYSLGVSAGVSLGLKSVIHEQRPDHSDNKSFPSGHATMAFASATTLHRRYGWQAGFPAYALATLTSVARVSANKHHWHDVGAGAVIGISSGWFFTDKFNDKVQLTPWVASKGGGLLVNASW